MIRIRTHKFIATLIATFFYSGYLRPASGTWGTFASLPLCLAITYYFGFTGIVFGTFIITMTGLWAAQSYMSYTQTHDPSEIVIDETAGMLVACIPLLISFQWDMIALCFILFRIFDAVKIGPVGWLDNTINGALGVMLDDIAAGLLTSLTLLGLLLWMN